MPNELFLGIISIATNGYTKYWEALIESANKNLTDKSRIRFHLFTDELEKSKEFSKKYSELAFNFYEIESLKWPEATLYRYRIYSEFSKQFTESHLMHLDSDMLIHGDFLELIFSSNQETEMRLVLHPGFFRAKALGRIKFYLKSPSQLLKDVKMYIQLGGLGAWETRVQSAAYVPRNKRKKYFCGGVWFGAQASFVRMVKDLEFAERRDSESGILARWHDESYLNNWAVNNKHSICTPSLCFDPSYRNLDGLDNLITAVDKGNHQR